MNRSIVRRPAAVAIAFGALLMTSMAARAADIPVSADTYTDSAFKTANYGRNGIVSVAQNRITLMRFNPAAIARTPGGTATLNLDVGLVKNYKDGIAVHLVAGPWDETKVTAATLPPISALALDEKTITTADQGKTVHFDITGALAAWRNDPSHNFGVAIMPSNPKPNLQFGARELKTGATLTIGGPAESDNRLWVFASSGLELQTSDGTRLLRVAAEPGYRFGSGAPDPMSGGVWVTESTGSVDEEANPDRLLRIGPTGAIERTISVVALRAGPVVDPRDGSVWISHLREVGADERLREILQFDRDGNPLAQFGAAMQIIDLALDEQSDALWVSRGEPGSGSPSELLRVTGGGAEETFFDYATYSIAVNPNQDTQGRGNVWLEDFDFGRIYKLNSAGHRLLQIPNDPNAFIEFGSRIAVNPLTGGVAALIVKPAEKTMGYAYFSALGVQTLFVPVANGSARERFPPSIVLDPYRNLLWTAISETLPGKTLSYWAALDARGHQVRTLTSSVIGVQSIRVDIAIGANNGALNPKQNVLVTVSVLAQGEFDALQVDPSAARFGPARAAPKAYRAKDVNGDGVPDLALDFSIPETGIACGDLYAGLTAVTHSSIPVSGNARIATQGCL